MPKHHLLKFLTVICRYSDKTSQWTLDYPPLFAWFEWMLAQLAVYVDPAMTQLDNQDYASSACIMFQVQVTALMLEIL